MWVCISTDSRKAAPCGVLPRPTVSPAMVIAPFLPSIIVETHYMRPCTQQTRETWPKTHWIKGDACNASLHIRPQTDDFAYISFRPLGLNLSVENESTHPISRRGEKFFAPLSILPFLSCQRHESSGRKRVHTKKNQPRRGCTSATMHCRDRWQGCAMR